MILRFDEYELDPHLLELRRGGAVIDVEPKPLALISLLAGSPDRVVSRDEIIEELWQGRAISDAALSTCVKAARYALEDSGQVQRLIRTYPRRGYRFVGEVSVSTTGSPRSLIVASPTRPIEVAETPEDIRSLSLPEGPSIAVLPFESLGTERDRFAFAEGLSRDITTRLGRARWLFVIARGSAYQFGSEDVLGIGSALAVRYVLQGSVQSADRRVRVNAALVDTIAKQEVWSETLERNVDDVFLIQEEITQAIAANVQVEIEQIERRRAMLKPMANLDAWSAYHRGWWHMDRHSAADYEHAEACFKLAIQLDPNAARATAGLSAVHRQRAFLNLTDKRDPELRRAFDLAEQSLSLDRADPQGHWAMGRALMLRDDVAAALTEFETANMLNPSFAMSHYSVGFGHAMIGDGATSDQALARALRLSPIDPMRFAMFATRAFNEATSGQPKLAADMASKAAAQPNAHYHILAVAAACHALANRSAKATIYAQRLRESYPAYESTDFFRAFPFRSHSHLELWRKGLQLVGIR